MSQTLSLSSSLLDSLPAEVQAYIRLLETQIVLISNQNQALTARVKELEDQLAKNSSNSSKPSSTDGLGKKTKSQREKSGKKPGGQPGHIGKSLKQVSTPNQIEVHAPKFCHNCQSQLEFAAICGVEKRQVFDLPEIMVIITEHQAQTRVCPCCGHKTKGHFPEGIRGAVQYGERVQALAAYFEHHHLIPFERISQIFEDLYGISLSSGTCSNMDKRLYRNLEVFDANLKAHLLACKVLHFDETGVRCEKKLNWIHVVSSTSATLYNLHRKRGCEAIDEHNILPRYKGAAVHDHWHPYFSYEQVKHFLCNGHHLRELKFVHEQEKAPWAEKMNQLLLEAHKQVGAAKKEGKSALCPQTVQSTEKAYEKLILEASKWYIDAKEVGEEEKIGKGGFNLLKRLLRKQDCVLGFIKDFAIPFSNNLAEQDLRMEKVKQKISGCFRAFEGGQISCRVRSYISTARKQGWRIIDALSDAIRGSPRLLPL